MDAFASKFGFNLAKKKWSSKKVVAMKTTGKRIIVKRMNGRIEYGIQTDPNQRLLEFVEFTMWGKFWNNDFQKMIQWFNQIGMKYYWWERSKLISSQGFLKLYPQRLKECLTFASKAKLIALFSSGCRETDTHVDESTLLEYQMQPLVVMFSFVHVPHASPNQLHWSPG